MRESVPWKLDGENVKVVSWQSHAGPSSLGHGWLGDRPSRNCPTRDAERHPCEHAGRSESEPRCSIVNRTADLDSRDGKAETVFRERRLIREV